MDRRTFLKSGGAAAAATGALATAGEAFAKKEVGTGTAPGIAPSRTEIPTALPAGFSEGYLRDRADRLALRIGELTDGQVQLLLQPGSDVADLAAGQSDVQAIFGVPELTPSLTYFSALPGGYALAPEHFATWLSAGGGQMLWDEAAADTGLKALAAGHSGLNAGFWSIADIASPADLQGKTISTTGLAQDVAREVGLEIADAAGMPAQLTEPLMGVTAYLSEMSETERTRQPYWFSDGINQGGVVFSLGFQLDIWQRLGGTQQAAISAATSEAYHQSLSEHQAHDTMVAPHLMTANGIRRSTLPGDVMTAISHVSRNVLDDVASGNPQAARIHESYMLFRENVTGLSDPLKMSATS